MGEARRRKQAMAGDCKTNQIDQGKLTRALRLAVTAITPHSCFDCMIYATVGATVLRRLGVDAQVQMGDVVWRVGPGDADVIHHMETAGTATFGPTPNSRAFHAWIRIQAAYGEPAYVVDFTTWQLREKGARLDAADGRRTQVEFCPDYLWVPEKQCTALTPREVADSYKIGVFSYVTRRMIGEVKAPGPAAVATLTELTLNTYSALVSGAEVAIELTDASGNSVDHLSGPGVIALGVGQPIGEQSAPG